MITVIPVWASTASAVAASLFLVSASSNFFTCSATHHELKWIKLKTIWQNHFKWLTANSNIYKWVVKMTKNSVYRQCEIWGDAGDATKKSDHTLWGPLISVWAQPYRANRHWQRCDTEWSFQPAFQRVFILCQVWDGRNHWLKEIYADKGARENIHRPSW